MVESFCSKYFHGEEKVTILTLHNTKQKSSKGLLDFIRRFWDAALDCYRQFKEQELVEICIDNMSHEYRAHLENLDIVQFAQLLQKARKTAISVKPPTDERSKLEKKNAPQALVVSTNEPMVGEKRKSILQYPAPMKKWMPSLTNGWLMECLGPSSLCESLLRKICESHSIVGIIGMWAMELEIVRQSEEHFTRKF